jgi:transposase
MARTLEASVQGAILAAQRNATKTNVWLNGLLNRRHPNIAAVALANKNLRTVWALLAHGREFKADYASSAIAA